ncbi:MAG: hypothetical protein IJ932_04500 [Ruminococcus sp.]|nr:hypothetical protein [Ruminococcus sp.]
MNSIESELFDEYKRVDSICRDMFFADKGVSAYIEQMEMTPTSMRYKFVGWDNDYKQLKHIRWVRNQLAHETGYVECTQADVVWLRNFHDRLLNRTDPLANVVQLEREAQAARVKPNLNPNPNPYPYPNKTIPIVTPIVYTNKTKPKRIVLPAAIAVACVAAVAALVVLLFWFMNK